MENVNNNNENINRCKPLLILVSFKNYKVKFNSAKCTMFTRM